MPTTIGFDLTDGTILMMTGETPESLANLLAKILPALPWDGIGIYQGDEVMRAFAVMHIEMFDYHSGTWAPSPRFYRDFGDGVGEYMRLLAHDSAFVARHLDPLLDDGPSADEHAAQERDMLHRI